MLKDSKLNSSINNILYSIILFLIIFNPPILKGFSFTKLFIAISFFVVIMFTSIFIDAVYVKAIKNWLLILITIFCYYFLVSSLNLIFYDRNASIIINNLINVLSHNVSIVLVSLLIVYLFNKQHCNIYDLFQSYVYVGVIQSILSITSYFSPRVKEYLNSMMAINSNSEIIRVISLNTQRNFGFASQLYDNFGFAMSIIAILALICGLRGRKINYLFFAMITFVAIINARTSIVLIGISVLLLLIRSNQPYKNILRNVIIIVLLFFIAIIFYKNFDFSISRSTIWLKTGIDEMLSLVLNNQKVGYFDKLFNEFIFFPNSIFEIVIGTGMLPSDLVKRGTDVGYVQNIWQYGILGSSLIIYFYAYAFKKWIAKATDYSKLFAILLCVMMAIYMIKLNCFGYGQAATIYMPIMLYALYTEYQEGVIKNECITINFVDLRY